MALVIIKSTLTFSFCYFVFTSGTFGLMEELRRKLGGAGGGWGSIKSRLISVQNLTICSKQKNDMQTQTLCWLLLAQNKGLT